MKKICVLLAFWLLSANAQAADDSFQLAFSGSSKTRVKAGENIKLNWWLQSVPTAGRVQVYLSGKTDRGVLIASSGYFKGETLLEDQIGRTASGTHNFDTTNLPSGSYELVAYICDSAARTCNTDRYSLNRHKSNSLDIEIVNNSSHYLDFNDNDFLTKSYDFDDPVSFRWFNENYRVGFLSFMLEGGDGTIYDLVLDSTFKNEARNDIGTARETRQKQFDNRAFNWIGVTESINGKYTNNEDSPYFGKTIKLDTGLYRILMYVHRNINAQTTVENYIIKSMPFQLRHKVETRPSQSEIDGTNPFKVTPKQPEEVIIKGPDTQDPGQNPDDKEESEETQEEQKSQPTPNTVTKAPDLKQLEQAREGLEERTTNRRLNRRQLLELYQKQATTSSAPQKNNNLSLLERIKKQQSSSPQVVNPFDRSKRITRTSRITQRSSMFTR